jgi:hypothetical protein
MNPTGERLKQMTGIAATLRYDVEGLDDIEEDDCSSSDSDDSSDSSEAGASNSNSK